jgi:hypothetical protein
MRGNRFALRDERPALLPGEPRGDQCRRNQFTWGVAPCLQVGFHTSLHFRIAQCIEPSTDMPLLALWKLMDGRGMNAGLLPALG